MKRSSTTINYWLGLNKLAEERIVDDGSTEVFRPDSEVGDDSTANGWDYYDIGWDSSFGYDTDSVRGKMLSFGATGAASILNGDLYGADLNPSDTPWAATGRRHLGFWFRNDSATSNQIKIYCRASSGYGTLVFVTGAGTDYIDSGNGCYVYYLANSGRFPAINDGNWNYIELDLGALQTQFSGVAGAITHVDGMMLAIADTASIHMDDIILSAGEMERSYGLGYTGAQTGNAGARDVNTQYQCVSAWGKYYYHSNTIAIAATTDANGSKIGVYLPDSFGRYRYIVGYQPDTISTTNKFIDFDAGLINFNNRWYDSERGHWISKEPLGLDGPNLYQYSKNNPYLFFDIDGLHIEYYNDPEIKKALDLLRKDRVYKIIIEDLETNRFKNEITRSRGKKRPGEKSTARSTDEGAGSGDMPGRGSASTVLLLCETFDDGTPIPLFIVLSHELIHMYEANHGVLNKSKSDYGDWDISEDHAMLLENRIRIPHGYGVRYDHEKHGNRYPFSFADVLYYLTFYIGGEDIFSPTNYPDESYDFSY